MIKLTPLQKGLLVVTVITILFTSVATVPSYCSLEEEQTELIFFNSTIKVEQDKHTFMFSLARQSFIIQINDTQYEVEKIIFTEEGEAITYIVEDDAPVKRTFENVTFTVENETLRIGNTQYHEVRQFKVYSGGLRVVREKNVHNDDLLMDFFDVGLCTFFLVGISYTAAWFWYKETKKMMEE